MSPLQFSEKEYKLWQKRMDKLKAKKKPALDASGKPFSRRHTDTGTGKKAKKKKGK